MKTLTMGKLIEWGVCDAARFAEYVGEGIPVAPESVYAAEYVGLDFDPNWLSSRLFDGQKLDAYNKSEADALAAHHAAFTPEMRAEYIRLSNLLQSADSDYRAAIVDALAEGVRFEAHDTEQDAENCQH